jgi:hypothetical protein
VAVVNVSASPVMMLGHTQRVRTHDERPREMFVW